MLLTPADKLYRMEKPEESEIPMSGAASADAQPGQANDTTASQADNGQ